MPSLEGFRACGGGQHAAVPPGRRGRSAIADETRRTTTSSVARQHEITPSLLFRWRRELLQQEQSADRPLAPIPGPVDLATDPGSDRPAGLALSKSLV